MYACYETSLPLQCKKEMAILPASKTKAPGTGCKEPQSWGFILPHMTNESLMGGVRRRILRRVLRYRGCCCGAEKRKHGMGDVE